MSQVQTKHFSIEKSMKENQTIIVLDSKLTNPNIIARVWNELLAQIKEIQNSCVIDASNITEINSFGIALIYKIKKELKERNLSLEIKNLKPEFETLLHHFSDFELEEIKKVGEFTNVETFGKEFEQNLISLIHLIEYLGEIAISFFSLFTFPKQIRWKEVIKISEITGAGALPIIALIGFLLGLITSFQSAIPMQRFGAEIFVANLVSLSLFRELGPLMTAIIMAGRSGSSFAAEIGTMKVNEELDALTTMGLNPVSFLILPRLLAAMFVSPLLTIFFNLFGLIGSAIVILSFGYPLVTFINQATKSVRFIDMFGGLFKSIVFGFLISMIGCLSGLQTKEGASAVGESTTRSVVAGIIVIAATDGIFAVIFYLLGI